MVQTEDEGRKTERMALQALVREQQERIAEARRLANRALFALMDHDLDLARGLLHRIEDL